MPRLADVSCRWVSPSVADRVGYGMNQRFLVAAEPGVERFIVRDADSRYGIPRARFAGYSSADTSQCGDVQAVTSRPLGAGRLGGHHIPGRRVPRHARRLPVVLRGARSPQPQPHRYAHGRRPVGRAGARGAGYGAPPRNLLHGTYVRGIVCCPLHCVARMTITRVLAFQGEYGQYGDDMRFLSDAIWPLATGRPKNVILVRAVGDAILLIDGVDLLWNGLCSMMRLQVTRIICIT
jgi:hypothetical protein